jgi:hypothetical protein
MDNEVLLRHKFSQPGRTVSLSVRIGANNSNTDSYQHVKTLTTRQDTVRNQESVNPITNWTLRSRLLYTEPLGKRGLLQVGYNLSFDPSKSNRHTYNLDTLGVRGAELDSLYSNIYANDYTKHRAELAYRWLTDKMNLSLGVDYEHADLNGHQEMPAKPDVKKSFDMPLPNARVEYKFTPQKTLRGAAAYSLYSGLSEGYNQEYLRIDASLGKKFLKGKNAELRISVYDLLNQAKSYNRSVTADYIEDSSSSILSRYFMLSFVYSLRNFSGQQPPRDNAQEGDGERRRRDGGGRMRDGRFPPM